MLLVLQVEVLFHGVAYILTVSIISGEGSDTMSIEVEQKSDASRWRGDFTSRCKTPEPMLQWQRAWQHAISKHVSIALHTLTLCSSPGLAHCAALALSTTNVHCGTLCRR